MRHELIVVMVTTKDRAQAKRIAKALLNDKLIACSNILGGVESLFLWGGKLSSSKEALLILKTKKSLFKDVTNKIKSLHSYQAPEIIALPVVLGDASYVKWVKESTC